ncbi:MAG: methyltransferase [Gammaproteobacteria bacterium]
MTDSPPARLKPDTVNRHLGNVYPALAMMAGMQLEVFSALGDDALDVAAVAAALDVEPTRLRPLLYALVCAGLLEVEDEVFRNTAESAEFLVRGRPRYIGSMHTAYADLWSSTMLTAESIRTGVPQAKHDFGRMTPDELRAFVKGIDAGAGASARRLHKEYDMSRFAHVLDAGGGSGGLAVALVGLCPGMRATVAELGNVAAITRECIAEAALEQSIDVVEADLVAEVPPGRYDAAVLRSVLQVMSEGEAKQTLANVAAAVKPGGEVFVFGRMLDDSRLSPADAVAVNVMFLNVYEHGQAYTEAEHRAWFADAGLAGVERLPVAGGYSVMRGRRA